MTDLTHFVRTYDGAFSPEYCRSLIEFFEGNSQWHIANGKNARSGLSDSSWVEMDIGRYSVESFQQGLGRSAAYYKAMYERDCGIDPPLPVGSQFSELIIKRYRPNHGEEFQAHYDSLGPVSNRHLVFLWYLSDVEEGGETEFVDLQLKIKLLICTQN